MHLNESVRLSKATKCRSWSQPFASRPAYWKEQRGLGVFLKCVRHREQARRDDHLLGKPRFEFIDGQRAVACPGNSRVVRPGAAPADPPLTMNDFRLR